MTFRLGNHNLLRSIARAASSRLRPSDRPTLQIEPLEDRRLLAGDTAPNVFGSQDLSPSVEAAFARASDLDQYSVEELSNTTSWAAHLTPGFTPDDLAQLLQIDVAGLQVPEYASNTVIFDQAGQPGASPFGTAVDISGTLSSSSVVDYFYPLVSQQLAPRSVPNDPIFPEQWHLFNYGQSGGVQGVDGNVVSVWDEFTGNGVVIGIVDDALQGSHPDLVDNFRPDLSIDLVGGDTDPSPESTFDGHGTSVAGIAAAVGNNGIGGTGVAFDAGIAGIRLLGANQTDETTALAFGQAIDTIDISNNSWGPVDGAGLDGIGPLALMAMENGTIEGRDGLGVVYVFAAGNGGQLGDWAGWDDFAGNRFGIAVAGINHRGLEPAFAEPGPNILVAAPTNTGFFGDVGITTTDLVGEDGSNTVLDNSDDDGHPDLDYTDSFGGTSAAAPYVSGVVALMLDANPNLSYRDVQHILVRTSDMTDPGDPNWTTNGFGRDINYFFGFGAVNAEAAVDLARVWTSVNELEEITTGNLVGDTAVTIPDFDVEGVDFPITVGTQQNGGDVSNFRLEHVEVTIDIEHEVDGDLEIVLTSPDGTESILSNPNGTDIGDFTDWTFTTVRHWDEGIAGTWNVQVRDVFAQTEDQADGTVNSVQINFFGTSESPDNLEVVANDNGTISGIVYFDADSDGTQDLNEPGLGGRLVFLDADGDGQFDEGELSATTGPNGFYLFTGLEPGSYRVVDFTGNTSVPPGLNSIQTVSVLGQDVFDVDFGSVSEETNIGPSGTISGTVFNDVNGNGVQDNGESGVAGMVGYIDTNNNCIIGLGEPGAMSDADGHFEISGLSPGTYNVRMAPSPGQLQDLPCNGFQVFISDNGTASMSPAFATTASNDTNGGGSGGGVGDVVHGEVPGFLLGNAINLDDGVTFLSGLHAGRTETIGIDATQLSVSPGYLHAWIDFNGDGDWDDAGEQILQNARLDDGVNEIEIQIPANATAEMANARFRWALERALGPFDPALAGETEDYVVTIPSDGMTGLTANDDDLAATEDEQVILDVLNNDQAGSFSDSFTLTSVSTPDQGGTAVIENGMIVYTPAPDFTGVEKFSYTITDDLGGTSSATVCVTVGNVNDAPEAVDDMFTVDLDTSGVTLPVLNNDLDIDGDSLTITSISQPSQGGVAVVTNGGILYTPVAGFLGIETFTYTVDDGNGGTSTATVTVTVEDLPPLVNFRLEARNANGSIDTIQSGETFTLRGYVEDLREPALGVFSAFLDVLYDSDLVSVIGPVTDGNGQYTEFRQDVSTATLGEIDEVGGLAGVTIGDTGALGGGEFILFEVEMRADAGGIVDFTGNPSDIIPPHEVTLFGESFILNDSNITFVGDSLMIVNNDPIANDDQEFVNINSTDNVLTVLDNDSDLPNSSNLTITQITSGPQSGTATIAADGRSIVYTPNAGFSGDDTLVYEISDGQGGFDTATVTISVNQFLVDYTLQTTDLAGNPISTVMAGQQFQLQVFVEDLRDTPQGVFSAYSDITYPSAIVDADSVIMFSGNFPEATSGDLSAPGVIDEAGATDDSTVPTGGGVTLIYTVTFTATAEGVVSFVSDPADILPLHETTLFGVDEAIANEFIRYGDVSIIVEASGGQADNAVVVEDSTANAIDVLANDTVVGVGPLTITSVTNPTSQGGTVTISNGQLLYTPAPDFTGTDTFSYTTQDQSGNASGALVTVEVTNVNDDPNAIDDFESVLQNSSANVLDLLTNDLTDPDPAFTDNLTITSVGTPSGGGSVVIAQDGQSVIYTPQAGFLGSETFTYTISDGNGGTDTATANVNVVNTLPTAVGYTFTVTDANGNPLSGVNVGDEFLLNVFVEDTRPVFRGVFSAYLDVTWSGGDATLNGNFQYGELYPNTQSGAFDGAGNEINELGAVDGISEAAHDGVELLVSVPMTATVAGTITFTGNPADIVPPNETTVFGENDIVSPERQSFGVVTLDVSAAANNLRQNGVNQFDVNGDSSVSPIDALAVINALNNPVFASYTRNAGNTTELLNLDVSGDNSLSPLDALLVINELERLSNLAQPTVVAPGQNVFPAFVHTGGTLPVAGRPIVNDLVDSAFADNFTAPTQSTTSSFFQTLADEDESDESENVDLSFAQMFLNQN